MNELMSKFQNIIAGVIILLLLSYGTYNYVFKPKLRTINDLQRSLNLINTEIKALPDGDKLIKDIGAAKAQLKTELDSLAVKVPSQVDIPYILNDYFSVVGKGMKVDYNFVQPMDLVQEQNFIRVPIRVEFAGNYSNLNLYLSQLKNLPITIRVDELEINKVAATKKLLINMLLSTFVMPGGQAKPSTMTKAGSYIFDPFYVNIQKQAVVNPAKKGVSTASGLNYLGYWNSRQIKAIINDEIYEVGDSVDGYKITGIDTKKVSFMKDKKKFEIQMGNGK